MNLQELAKFGHGYSRLVQAESNLRASAVSRVVSFGSEKSTRSTGKHKAGVYFVNHISGVSEREFLVAWCKQFAAVLSAQRLCTRSRSNVFLETESRTFGASSPHSEVVSPRSATPILDTSIASAKAPVDTIALAKAVQSLGACATCGALSSMDSKELRVVSQLASELESALVDEDHEVGSKSLLSIIPGPQFVGILFGLGRLEAQLEGHVYSLRDETIRSWLEEYIRRMDENERGLDPVLSQAQHLCNAVFAVGKALGARTAKRKQAEYSQSATVTVVDEEGQVEDENDYEDDTRGRDRKELDFRQSKDTSSSSEDPSSSNLIKLRTLVSAFAREWQAVALGSTSIVVSSESKKEQEVFRKYSIREMNNALYGLAQCVDYIRTEAGTSMRPDSCQEVGSIVDPAFLSAWQQAASEKVSSFSGPALSSSLAGVATLWEDLGGIGGARELNRGADKNHSREEQRQSLVKFLDAWRTRFCDADFDERGIVQSLGGMRKLLETFLSSMQNPNHMVAEPLHAVYRDLEARATEWLCFSQSTSGLGNGHDAAGKDVQRGKVMPHATTSHGLLQTVYNLGVIQELRAEQGRKLGDATVVSSLSDHREEASDSGTISVPHVSPEMLEAWEAKCAAYIDYTKGHNDNFCLSEPEASIRSSARKGRQREQLCDSWLGCVIRAYVRLVSNWGETSTSGPETTGLLSARRKPRKESPFVEAWIDAYTTTLRGERTPSQRRSLFRAVWSLGKLAEYTRVFVKEQNHEYDNFGEDDIIVNYADDHHIEQDNHDRYASTRTSSSSSSSAATNVLRRSDSNFAASCVEQKFVQAWLERARTVDMAEPVLIAGIVYSWGKLATALDLACLSELRAFLSDKYLAKLVELDCSPKEGGSRAESDHRIKPSSALDIKESDHHKSSFSAFRWFQGRVENQEVSRAGAKNLALLVNGVADLGYSFEQEPALFKRILEEMGVSKRWEDNHRVPLEQQQGTSTGAQRVNVAVWSHDEELQRPTFNTTEIVCLVYGFARILESQYLLSNCAFAEQV
ncbi:unnamed protein product [Amoebophrya sp. A25]|nr:unnamed protein product [Amoebophrya sp. A25]|eukprot:GSA25T00025715001.1